MSFRDTATHKIFGLLPSTTPTSVIDTAAQHADVVHNIQGTVKKSPQSTHPLLSFLTTKNVSTPVDMSRLSYIYDMREADQIPNQVFKTQLELSLFHGNEERSDQDASLVIKALVNKGQAASKGKEMIHVDNVEKEPRKRVKIFADISSSEEEDVAAMLPDQETSKMVVEEEAKEGGLFGFSHLMPKISRLGGVKVSNGQDISVIEEDIEDDVVVERFKRDIGNEEEVEESEDEEREDKRVLSRKKQAQKADKKIDKQIKAIERMLPEK